VTDPGPDAPLPKGMTHGAEADAWRGAAETGMTRRANAPALAAWTPSSATLATALVAQIVEWAQNGLPNEACGLLAAARVAEDGGAPTRFIPMRNAAASPYRYEMESQELLTAILDIDDRDEVVWGIVHSHVASKAEPSATDVGLAAYQDALYLICSLAVDPPVVRAWSIVDGGVSEVVLHRT
jgi:[CysO sulfur-carrier protein]-S-L-cysteine hydrolase